MDNSFINRIAAGWEPKKTRGKKPTKLHKDDWNWFFKDSDKDGVMNGIDCKPYNRKKQDNPPFLQANTSQLFGPQSVSTGQIKLDQAKYEPFVSVPTVSSGQIKADQAKYDPFVSVRTVSTGQIKADQAKYQPFVSIPTVSSGQIKLDQAKYNPIISTPTVSSGQIKLDQSKYNTIVSTPTVSSGQIKADQAKYQSLFNTSTVTLAQPSTNKNKYEHASFAQVTSKPTLTASTPSKPTYTTLDGGASFILRRPINSNVPLGGPPIKGSMTDQSWKEVSINEMRSFGFTNLNDMKAAYDPGTNSISYKPALPPLAEKVDMNWEKFRISPVPVQPTIPQKVDMNWEKITITQPNMPSQNKLSPETLNTMRNIISQSPPMATSSFPTINAKNFKLPTDTHSFALPDLRTNEEKLTASRQALASQLEATAIAGSIMVAPIAITALGGTALAAGTVGMLSGEAIGGLHSVAQEGKVDARDIAKNVAIGGVIGGVTGYGATKLFSNPGMIKIADYGPSGKAAETIYKLPGGAYVNRAVTNVKAEIGQVFPKPTVQSVTNKLGNTLYSIGSTKLTPAETAVMQKELSRRLAQDVAQPTVQSVTNKLGTTFSQIAGTKLTPAETVVMQNELAQRLAKDVGTKVATAAGFGIGGMMLNNPLSLGSKIKSLEIPTQTQSVLTRETAVGKAMAQTVTGSSGKGIDKMTPEERKSLIPIPTKVVNKEKIDSGRTLASTDYSTTDKQFPKAANITKIEYSNNGVPFNKDLWIQEGKYISPEGKEYTSNYVNYYDNVGQHIGYEVKLYPADLSSKKFNLYDSGLNRDNIEALGRVERAGYINNRNINVDSAGNRTNAAKDLTVQKSTEYLKNTGFKTEYVKEIPIFGVKETAGGIMDPLTKTVSIAETSQDKNATLIHETSHAQDFSNPIKGITDTLGITPGFKSGMTAYKEGKLSDVDSPIYSWIPPQLRGTEAKAHYIDEYYKGNLPRNDMVDAFEKQLGILNTSNTATGIDVIKAGNLYAEVAQQATK